MQWQSSPPPPPRALTIISIITTTTSTCTDSNNHVHTCQPLLTRSWEVTFFHWSDRCLLPKYWLTSGFDYWTTLSHFFTICVLSLWRLMLCISYIVYTTPQTSPVLSWSLLVSTRVYWTPEQASGFQLISVTGRDHRNLRHRPRYPRPLALGKVTGYLHCCPRSLYNRTKSRVDATMWMVPSCWGSKLSCKHLLLLFRQNMFKWQLLLIWIHHWCASC